MDRFTNRGWNYWLRLISVGLIGGLLLALVLVEIFYISAVTKPAPSEVGSPPLNKLGTKYQPVNFKAEPEGVLLSGWYLPGENGATIILLHGFGSNRLEMLERADILSRHGYGVLLYDLRGHGKSGGEKRAFGWQDVNDVRAALDYLINDQMVDIDRIGILGFSIGGQIAIRAAADYQEIRAVIADDPGFVTVDDAPEPRNLSERLVYSVSWIDGRCVSLWTGIPIPAGVPDKLSEISPRPLLLISTGEAGGQYLVSHYYQIAGQPKQLWEIPETYHGGQLEARPVEYEERMISFFNTSLKMNGNH